MHHELKTWPAPFAAVKEGCKKFELRKNDRNFKVGDTLVLREWIPQSYSTLEGYYTDRSVTVRVTYICEAGSWGLPPNLCVLSIEEYQP